jgi:hypothetical protein
MLKKDIPLIFRQSNDIQKSINFNWLISNSFVIIIPIQPFGLISLASSSLPTLWYEY